MENLDVYNEYMEHVGVEDREKVHAKGLWHKTIHCWLYDKNGNVYFQIRKNENQLYTTASGHVLAGETVKDAFSREVFEEIGVKVSTKNATLVEICAWRMDAIKNNKPFIDRAFAHVYVNEVEKDFTNFKLDPTEVVGVVKVNAQQCLNLLMGNVKTISGLKFTDKQTTLKLTINDFLVNPHEIGIIKYGLVLQTIIALTGQK